MVLVKMNRKRTFYRLIMLLLLVITMFEAKAEKHIFYFGDGYKEGYQTVSSATLYGNDSPYGYDLIGSPKEQDPFFFSIRLPEGNYRVTVVLGNRHSGTHTTIRSESRRLMLANVESKAGTTITRSFVVNTRNTRINADCSVRLKPRETGKLNWDEKLTLEINGRRPGLLEMVIEKAEVPTIFLAGNSTVTDQDNEPWCGWGQMLPLFLNDRIAVANYAESGEAGNSFISAGRFAKILTKMKKGDWLFIEFGHNDQKQTGPGKGPYDSYTESLKQLITGTREKGGTPVLVTPMHRRQFDDDNMIINTLGEYPDAMRELAKQEQVALIDLNSMSKTLYEAWGPEQSKRAFVHYPAGTFPGQTEALADNTHFNAYGGDQLVRCIIKGIIDNNLPIGDYFREGYIPFDPAHPDVPDTFFVSLTPFYSIIKPEGN
jgi:lysophospholipase L1-like esterase